MGKRIWNKQDYQNPGQKWKPEDQWIRIKDAHPAIINKEVFNLVKEKAKQRNRCLSPFKVQGSPFILRGLFKCPRCGSFMVSGQGSNSGRYRSVRKYYVCGIYQRKGKTVCTFHSFKKEDTENLVINALMREFTLLNLPGAIEDEIKRYTENRNRDISQRLQQIQQDRDFTARRIEILEKDIGKIPNAMQFTAYIEELKECLVKLEAEEKELASLLLVADISPSVIETIRYQLQEFIRSIKILPPDSQRLLLKKYIREINFELANNMFKIDILIPGIEQDSSPIIEKVCYVESPS